MSNNWKNSSLKKLVDKKLLALLQYLHADDGVLRIETSNKKNIKHRLHHFPNILL